jgi:hypothetical protein
MISEDGTGPISQNEARLEEARRQTYVETSRQCSPPSWIRQKAQMLTSEVRSKVDSEACRWKRVDAIVSVSGGSTV